MPLPGHRRRLAAATASSIAAAMTATVRITDDPAPPPAATSTPSRSSSQWSKAAAPAPAPGAPPAEAPEPRVLYEGPARVQALPSAALTVDVAGQDVSTRQVLVQLPLRTADGAELPRFAAGRTAGHMVHVLAEPNDAALVGARLRVVDVAFASQRLTRDLTCSYAFNINNPRGTT